MSFTVCRAKSLVNKCRRCWLWADLGCLKQMIEIESILNALLDFRIDMLYENAPVIILIKPTALAVLSWHSQF